MIGTLIGPYRIIDRLGNCQIGKHNLLISQMGIAGSSSTGDYVVVAGQVGITDHVHIGAGAIIGAKAGVTKDVPPWTIVAGTPAKPVREREPFEILPEHWTVEVPPTLRR